MSDTLAGKIAKVSAELSGWTADKHNKDQNYDYISADAVLTKAGSALAKAGVAIFPSATDIDIKIVERQNKAPRIDATVRFVMLVTDGDKEMSCPWVGAGSDYATPDKAVYKAITSGHKYFVMKLLNVGIGNEDGEHETESGQPEKVERKQTAKPAKVTAPELPVTKQPEQTKPSFNGLIDPQWLIDNQYSDSIPAAAKVINYLGIAGKAVEIGKPKLDVYRLWRNSGLEPKEAAEKTLAGEVPQE